ncbi:MAG: aromatic-ring-hydroxylating dioxygenase subunit beta [Actinomycetota bacterium]
MADRIDVMADTLSREEEIAAQQLLQDAADLLDRRRYRDWIDLFVQDGRYIAISAENHEKNLPLPIIDDTHDRMLDRADMIDRYWSMRPTRTRHVTSVARLEKSSLGKITAVSTFAVFVTEHQRRVDVLAVGRYEDELQWRGDVLMFGSRHVIFDNDLIRHPVTYPL